MTNAPQVAYENYPIHVDAHNDLISSEDHNSGTSMSLLQIDQTENPNPDVNNGDQTISNPKQILGLRMRNFWILIGIAAFVVAASVGGSVGGSLAIRGSVYVHSSRSLTGQKSPTKHS